MPEPPAELALLVDGCRGLGIELSARQVEQFRTYRELLGRATELGISAIEEPAEIERRHLLESAALLRVLAGAGIEIEGKSLVDVGSGGGVPGVPLKVLVPGLRLTVVEAKSRRVHFLEEVVAALSLADVTLVNARAEDAAREPAYRERFDLATAKAVAPLAVLLELTLPFLRMGGWLVSPKGGEAAAEAAEAGRALAELGGELRAIAELPLAEPAQLVVLVEKAGPTPERYPRRAGMPAKRPLR